MRIADRIFSDKDKLCVLPTGELLWFFFVPMLLQRGNAYYIGSHAGAWEPGKGFRFGLTLQAGRQEKFR
jgi:hypothetical protein